MNKDTKTETCKTDSEPNEKKKRNNNSQKHAKHEPEGKRGNNDFTSTCKSQNPDDSCKLERRTIPSRTQPSIPPLSPLSERQYFIRLFADHKKSRVPTRAVAALHGTSNEQRYLFPPARLHQIPVYRLHETRLVNCSAKGFPPRCTRWSPSRFRGSRFWSTCHATSLLARVRKLAGRLQE